ncbi:hypothetical protein H7F51_07240 [Novosphingobium flavum]|uniref:Uncharacterized protein n=1 Tax=Novosphingobium flavum TaxID=1778672 RepID=A0A7X1KL81_9SPHN|nr:hypothetical protein [Novosphingobium flavum]MBC2665309.1 hypothetical protein [Novosphingobium flavum]
MADIDAALEQQVLDVSSRQRKRTYIKTAGRITSGDELKYLNGLEGLRGRGMTTALHFSALRRQAVHLVCQSPRVSWQMFEYLAERIELY